MAIPLYLKIKNELIESIKDLEANAPIMSERDLVGQFGASRMTVRKAVSEMVEEGYLYRDSNKGTFVSDKTMIRKDTLLYMDDTHYSIIYFDVKTSGSDEVHDALKLTRHDSIVRMIRLLENNGKPLSVEEVYIKRQNLTDTQVNDMANWRKFNQFVDAQGSVHHQFNPEMVPIKYANLLKLKLGTPIIVVNTIIRTKQGEPLVFRKSYNNSNERLLEVSSTIS